MIPEPEIIQRQPHPEIEQYCLQQGMTPLQARIAAARLSPEDPLDAILNPRLRNLQSPSHLKDAECAAQRIADAIMAGESIALATDYDADGVTSAWVLREALIHHFGHPQDKVHVFLNARANGYGLNDAQVAQILAQHARSPIALVITADQGGCDEPRIRRLKDAGIRVCVTDHHQLGPDGPPSSADCVVNPQRSDCQYDNTVAGCMVAFLVMGETRRVLMERGWLPADTPSLKPLLTKVALGTIADSVSLKSPNNRAVVRAGLSLINQLTHPVWQAVQRFTRTRGWLDESFLAFEVATRINAASRVNDVQLALDFLSSTTPEAALEALKALEKDNRYRKAQQQSLMEQARSQVTEQVRAGRRTLTVILQGTPGIQGIVAQRIGELFSRPTVAFTDLEDGTLAGSGRGIATGLDLNRAFAWMAQQQPDLFLSMGGHAGAAGCTIPKEGAERFARLLEQAVCQQLGNALPRRELLSDGALQPQQLHAGLLQEIGFLAPYGQGWPAPRFDNVFEVLSSRIVGADRTHLSLTLRMPGGGQYNAIYFNGQWGDDEHPRLQAGDRIHACYAPTLSQFAGRQQFQLRIEWAGKVI